MQMKYRILMALEDWRAQVEMNFLVRRDGNGLRCGSVC